jgi:hypothetical protein
LSTCKLNLSASIAISFVMWITLVKCCALRNCVTACKVFFVMAGSGSE